jgi:hypothetical protein
VSGYVAVGGGMGAGIIATIDGDRLGVVAGPIFAQIERERRDGPRYCEAVRGARTYRERAYERWLGTILAPGLIEPRFKAPTRSVNYAERSFGIPEFWITRKTRRIG